MSGRVPVSVFRLVAESGRHFEHAINFFFNVFTFAFRYSLTSRRLSSIHLFANSTASRPLVNTAGPLTGFGREAYANLSYTMVVFARSWLPCQCESFTAIRLHAAFAWVDDLERNVNRTLPCPNFTMKQLLKLSISVPDNSRE